MSPHPEPIRVCYIIDNLHMGGAQHHLVEVLANLNRSRVSARVVSLQAERADLAPMIQAMDLSFETFDLKKFYGWSAWLWTLRMAARLRRDRVDVVHAYLLGANMLGILAAWMARVPVRIATRRGTGSNTLKRRHRIAWRFFNRLANCIVAVARAVGDESIRSEGLPHSKVVTIHNGVDLAHFAPREGPSARRALRLGSERRILGTVANLVPWKGHADILDVAARLVREDHDLHLIFVGDGPLRGALERTAQMLGLAGRITFAGRQEDVRPWIAAMDILIQASTGEEGLSNAILEAMAMAKPVVASRYGGNPEAVVDGRTGWLFPPEDREALHALLSGALRDLKKTESFGLAGRALAEAEFGMDRMIQRMTDLYEFLLEGKPRSVAFAIPSMDIGGAETDVLNLSKGLRSRGCAVAVVAHGGRLLEELRKDGVPCFEIPVDGRSPAAIARAAWLLSREAVRERWQIINAQSAYTTVIGALCRLFLLLRLRFRRPTLITTIHAIGRKEDTQVDSAYLRPVNWILRFLPHRVIFESHYEMGQVFPDGQPAHCRVIHNGAADRFFSDSGSQRVESRQALGIGAADAVVATVAALIPLKGHRYFLEAASYALKEFPQTRFLVIGDGPERKNLEELVRQLGIEDHVLFLGPRRDVADLLPAVDIFVLASLRESFPLSIREAMAAGRAVVASRVGGNPELIRDGETGLLVPPADGVALGLAISRLLADPELRMQIAAGGRREAERKYRMNHWLNETECAFWEGKHKIAEASSGTQARL